MLRFSSFWETPPALTQGSGAHANLGAAWNDAGANQAKGAILAPLPGGWGTSARMPTPPWAPFPHLHPKGPSPLTPHEGGPSPPSLACPLLLRPCGHGCVWWLGGQLCQGTGQGLFGLFAW